MLRIGLARQRTSSDLETTPNQLSRVSTILAIRSLLTGRADLSRDVAGAGGSKEEGSASSGRGPATLSEASHKAGKAWNTSLIETPHRRSGGEHPRPQLKEKSRRHRRAHAPAEGLESSPERREKK